MPEDRLLKICEVARLCSVTHTTILRWIDDGMLEVVVLPSGLRRVWLSTVLAWIGQPIETHEERSATRA